MRTLTLMAASLLLAACSTQAPQPVGNDQDAHGCRASAGYQWSPLLGQCVRLCEQAVRLQVREGQTRLTDGPFAETKEMVGGFFLIDCATRDEAIAIARDCPAAEWATVEVRELAPCYQ